MKEGILEDLLEIQSLREVMGQGVLTALHAREIQDKDLQSPFWSDLYKQYEKATKPVYRAVVSLCNATVHQKRHFIAINREGLKLLLKNDPNWPSQLTFSNETYKLIIKAICQRHFKLIIPASGRRPQIYEVIHPVLVKEINLTQEEKDNQRLEIEEFIENVKDSKQDINKDTVNSIEYEDKEKSIENVGSQYKVNSLEKEGDSIEDKILAICSGLANWNSKSEDEQRQNLINLGINTGDDFWTFARHYIRKYTEYEVVREICIRACTFLSRYHWSWFEDEKYPMFEMEWESARKKGAKSV